MSSKAFPLSKQSPLHPTPPFLEKIFHPYPFVKLEEINPVYKGGGVRTMLLTKKRESITLRLSQETFGEFVVVFSIKVNLCTS